MSPSLTQYLETALWCSCDDGGNPLDSRYSISDIAPESIARAEQDWDTFQAKAGHLLDGLDLTDVAHDFWLTRNHHGAGFWDGDYPEAIGKALTDLSETFNEIDPYVGDDGVIRFY